MRSAADRHEFDILLVDDLSRLARDQVESERVIRRLEFQGIRIVATADGYDTQTKTATRKIQRTVKGLVNEMRLDELREQVHRGLTGQAIKGYWCGGRVYGYALRPILNPTRRDPYGQPKRIGTKLEIDTQRAAIVREIYRRYADGASCRTIAKDLNGQGVPSAGST
jgi:DNA invertase Pin-like site-specific DNA recombinase